jgi:CBS domain-containing protein
VAEPLAELDPRRPVQLPAAATVAEAIRAMQERRIGAVLVTEPDNGDGHLAGIFTERDALLRLDPAVALDGITLGDVMTRDPVVLRASDSVAVAIHKMAVGGFRHIPLVDGDDATGIVSARDLFRHLVEVIDSPHDLGAVAASAMQGTTPTSDPAAQWPFAQPEPTDAGDENANDGVPEVDDKSPTSGGAPA